MAVTPVANYTNDTFKRYLMIVSTGIVWKNRALAIKCEAAEDMYLAELFETANKGMLNYDVIQAFPRIVLKGAGIPDKDLDWCAANKDFIPKDMRDRVVEEYTKALTSKNPETGRIAYPYTYVSPEVFWDEELGQEVTAPVEHIEFIEVYKERNDYYRMLNGMPDLNDTDEIFNTDRRWPTNIPVWQMNLVDRLEMENEGVLDALVEKYPKKQYLKYCGRRMIDLYISRTAERFGILWMNNSPSSTLNSDFKDVYQGCINTINSVYYSDAFAKTNEYYENFLAMCVLFMTIQTMQYHYLTVDVIRDFYDTESLKYVYDSYGVPFYNDIPLEYHRKIVKNINRLIGYKGSSKVFFDLFGIFDFAEMDIYCYYIMKIRRTDENGNPTMYLERDADGNVVYDDDGYPKLSSENYELKFAKAPFYADPSLSIADKENQLAYDEMTVADPYWIEDMKLTQTLQEESFNFTESKYIGVQTVFDLLEIAYEYAYLFKMISDNRVMTDALTFRWSEYGITASFFDLFLYIGSLYCRYHGYAGQIASNLPYTSAILGFDFQKNMAELRTYVAANKYLNRDPELARLLSDMNIRDESSVNRVFENISAIQKILIEGYENSKTREEFLIYKELYDTLMTSQLIEEVYKDHNGETAETFEDLLADVSPDLASRLTGMTSQEQIEDELVIAINKSEELITSVKWLTYSAGIDSSRLIEALFNILKFFKSAKAELVGYDIIYKITKRGLNFIKLLMEMIEWKQWDIHLDSDQYLHDLLWMIQDWTRVRWDAIQLSDNDGTMSIWHGVDLKDMINRLDDKIYSIIWSLARPTEDELTLYDFLTEIHDKIMLRDKMPITDALHLVEMIYVEAERVPPIKDKTLKLKDCLYDNGTLTWVWSHLLLQDYIHYIDEGEIHLSTDQYLHDSLSPLNSTTQLEDLDKLRMRILEVEALITTQLGSHLKLSDTLMTNDFGIPVDEVLQLADSLEERTTGEHYSHLMLGDRLWVKSEELVEEPEKQTP
ncbi:MAG: hypothetical protein NC548_06465 [Lachnospiraceae bacterium]|nr:hypothetical protein [Lachnospiraceae bacterium]